MWSFRVPVQYCCELDEAVLRQDDCYSSVGFSPAVRAHGARSDEVRHVICHDVPRAGARTSLGFVPRY